MNDLGSIYSLDPMNSIYCTVLTALRLIAIKELPVQ